MRTVHILMVVLCCYTSYADDLIEATVTEIKRIKPPDVTEPWSAKDHYTQVKIQGLENITQTICFQLLIHGDGKQQQVYGAIVDWNFDEDDTVTFQDQIIDGEIKYLFVFEEDCETFIGTWNAKGIKIADMKSRVSFIDGGYVRVTKGILDSVQYEDNVCNKTDSPCYFELVEPGSIPEVQRCTTLYGEGEDELLYCDETISDVIAPEISTSFLLLNDEKMNLKYEVTNATSEVITNVDGAIVQIECEITELGLKSDPLSDSCSFEVKDSLKGKSQIDMTHVSVDDEGYVQASTKTTFQLFNLEVSPLTKDTIRASWSSDSVKTFNVFVSPLSDIYDHQLEMLNFECDSEKNNIECEAFFLDLTLNDDDHIGIVQDGNNAIGKTVTGGFANMATISKIYQDSKDSTTFTVSEGTVPKKMNLVEIQVIDKNTTNNIFNCEEPFEGEKGFGIKCTNLPDLQTERQFLLVEYDNFDDPTSVTRVSAAYFSFIESEVDLDWVTENLTLRGNVFNTTSITIDEKLCDQGSSPCYFFDVPQIDKYVQVCTEIENKAPDCVPFNQCEDKEPKPHGDIKDLPSLLLLDKSSFNLRYNTSMPPKIELFVVTSGLKPFQEEGDFTCHPSTTNDNIGCSVDLNVTLVEESSLLNIAIVHLNELGEVTETDSSVFQLFAMDAFTLTEDAAIVTWSNVIYENDYIVRLKSKDDLDYAIYSLNRHCALNDANCDSYLVDIESMTDKFISVQIGEENQELAHSINSKELGKSSIKKIINTPEDPENSLTSFVFEGETPIHMKVIEITGTSTHTEISSIDTDITSSDTEISSTDTDVTSSNIEIFNTFYDGSIDELEKGIYAFNCSEGIGSTEGIRKFLFVESATDSSDIARVGAAYVTFADLSIQLDWVTEQKLIRGVPKDENTPTIGGIECDGPNPCYITEFISHDIYVPVCIKIENEADSGNEIDQCDDAEPQTPKDVEEDMTFLLIDNSNLTVKHDEDHFGIEIFAVDENENWISEGKSVDCSEIDSDLCTLDVQDLTGDLSSFKILFIDEEEKVAGSATHPFKVFDMETSMLADDAVMMRWSADEQRQFHADIIHKTYLNTILEMDITCGDTEGKANPCESYFVDIDNMADYIAVVQDEFNAIGKTLLGFEKHDRSPVFKIAHTLDSDNIVTKFSFNATSKPSSVKMLEVTMDGNVVSNIPFEGDVQGITEGFSFTTQEDIRTEDGIRKFIFVEYGEENKVETVYVDFKELDVKLDWLGNSSVLREYVNTDDMKIMIGDNTCDRAESPCYLTPLEIGQTGIVPLCTTIVNEAHDTEVVMQCEDQDPGYPSVMELSTLNLKEGDENSLTITAPDLCDGYNVKLVLFVDGKLSDKEKDCVKEGDSCEATNLELPSSESSLGVLVMCTDESEEVQGSAYSNVDHLEFTTNRLTADSLVVYWKAVDSDSKEYIVELVKDDAVKISENEFNTDNTSSKISCDSDRSCYAVFLNLEPGSSYHVSVHKIGDSVSTTDEDIGKIDDLPEPVGKDILISKLRKIDDHNTKIYLSESNTPKVQVLVKFLSSEPSIEQTGEGVKVADDIINFYHKIPLFDAMKDATFTIIGFDGPKISEKAIMDIELQHLDSTMSWVGDRQGNIDATLRVDTASLPNVKIGTKSGSKTCSSKESPCYYIEDLDFPEDLESCIELEQNVAQCSEQVTSYNKLYGIEMSLKGDKVDIKANSVAVDSELEVKIYDPENTTVIYSTGNTICDPVDLENGQIDCKQPLQVPNNKDIVNILISEISPNGVVLASALKDLPIPDSTGSGTEPWVIAVSVLGSVFLLTIIVFLTAVVMKRRKARKWQSETMERELDAISEISAGYLSKNSGGGANVIPPTFSDSFDNTFDKKYTRGISRDSITPPQRRRDNYPKPQNRNNSRYDDHDGVNQPQQYPRDNYQRRDSIQKYRPMSTQLPRTPSYDDHQSGHVNYGYSPSPMPRNNGVPLPGMIPKVSIKANRPSPSPYRDSHY